MFVGMTFCGSAAMNAVRGLSPCSGESNISGRAEEERRDWESWQVGKLSPGLVETGKLGMVGMARRGRVGKRGRRTWE